jgi:NAD(P)-dependent dehydrogenase (short-subunit alcohol dehydrogenase family)
MHMRSKLDFDDLQLRRGYSGWDAYAKSKLANVLFTYELARRLRGTQVSANALHPGYVGTSFGRLNRTPIRLGRWEEPKPGARSPEEGAHTSIYLASSAEVEGVSGRYFVNERDTPSSPESYDEETARLLWEISTDLADSRSL